MKNDSLNLSPSPERETGVYPDSCGGDIRFLLTLLSVRGSLQDRWVLYWVILCCDYQLSKWRTKLKKKLKCFLI